MKYVAVAILILSSAVQPAIPQRWKVSYHLKGQIQWMYVPGDSAEDALDYLYWVRPGARAVALCHTEFADCRAKGE